MKLLISIAPHCVNTRVFLSAKMTQMMERQRVSAEQRLMLRPREGFSSSSSLVPSFEKGGYWFQRRVLRVLWHWWDRVMPSHSSDVYYWLTSGSRQGTSKAGHGWQLRYVLGSRGAMSLSKHACETLQVPGLGKRLHIQWWIKREDPWFYGQDIWWEKED